MQLGRLIAVGITIYVCPCVALLSVPSWRAVAQSWHGTEIWTFLCLAALSFAIWLSADWRLSRGIRDGIWQESDLTPLRTLLGRREIGAIVWIPAAVWLVFLVVAHNPWREIGWAGCYLVPLQVLWQLRVLLAPRRETKLRERPAYKPLQSEHWGEPR